MQVVQHILEEGQWVERAGLMKQPAQLALALSCAERLASPQTWESLRALHPGATIVACSTAGEILEATVTDDALVCTGLRLDRGCVSVATAMVDENGDSHQLGRLLGQRVPQADLVHVLVLSDGLRVNGSALVAGLIESLPAGVSVSGGLAGDGARFQSTTVCVDGPQSGHQVVAIGLHGGNLRVGLGCQGGWEPFGIERRITRSEGNVLLELDGEPALDLYRRYLGAKAEGLPATGLLFPLAIRPDDGQRRQPVVRTILSVDPAAHSLTFAGDVPVGYRARLMRARVDDLVDGAQVAAVAALGNLGGLRPQLALLVSCVGRKLVMKQRVEEEVEAVREVLGPEVLCTGFYSYGELAPQDAGTAAELHNQTMTITALAEV